MKKKYERNDNLRLKSLSRKLWCRLIKVGLKIDTLYIAMTHSWNLMYRVHCIFQRYALQNYNVPNWSKFLYVLYKRLLYSLKILLWEFRYVYVSLLPMLLKSLFLLRKPHCLHSDNFKPRLNRPRLKRAWFN